MFNEAETIAILAATALVSARTLYQFVKERNGHNPTEILQDLRVLMTKTESHMQSQTETLRDIKDELRGQREGQQNLWGTMQRLLEMHISGERK